MSFIAHLGKGASALTQLPAVRTWPDDNSICNAGQAVPRTDCLTDHKHAGCRAEAARTELDAAFTQHKREAAAAVQEARGAGTTVATRATRLESELGALRTSEAAALQRATAAEARSRELSLVRLRLQHGGYWSIF